MTLLALDQAMAIVDAAQDLTADPGADAAH